MDNAHGTNSLGELGRFTFDGLEGGNFLLERWTTLGLILSRNAAR